MKLKTSFFNSTALRKDITRFAPLWALYTVFLLLTLMVMQDAPSSLAVSFRSAVSGMAIINMLYAGMCAMLLFGDLYSIRMCNALHAFPMRREGWFVTHLTAGLLFCLVPNLLACLIACISLQQYLYIAFFWLLVTVLQYLFFFGLAAFSALCTGSRFASIVVYGIGNFLPVLIYYLAETFYRPLLYGITLNFEDFTFFSPCIHMTGHQYVDLASYFVDYNGLFPEQWLYLLAVAGIGLLLMGLAMLMYRRRDLEAAGDFITVRALAPVFLVIYTVGFGGVMHGLGSLFSTGFGELFLCVGLVIGFFTGRMLLDRTVRVFQLKAFLSFAALIAALGLSLVITLLDPLGITRRVPTLQQVESLTVSTSQLRSGYDYAYSDDTVMLTDPEDIQAILDIHKTLVEDAQPAGSTVDLYLKYELTSGETLLRSYTVPLYRENLQTLKRLFSSPLCIFGTDDLQSLQKNVISMYAYADSAADIPQAAYADVLEAIYQDCLDGNMAQSWSFHQDEDSKYWMEISYHAYRTDAGVKWSQYLNLRIYPSCTNTLAVLEKYMYTTAPQ